MIKEGEFLWTGSDKFKAESNITALMNWLSENRDMHFTTYDELWQWSVARPEDFWKVVWDYFDLRSDTEITNIRSSDAFLGIKWFEGAKLNFAEHILRQETLGPPDRTVLQHCSELRPLTDMSWRELASKVRILATRLRAMGIGPGDCVAAYVPNIPECLIAMLATTAIGAIWSSAAPEFGVMTVVDRFSQISPKLLFVADGYRFGGKDFPRDDAISEILRNVGSVETVVWLSYLDRTSTPGDLPVQTLLWDDLLDAEPVDSADFEYEQVAGDHPLWVLFSSGTTGLPKAIVHGHLGILLEHYKYGAFHLNLKPDSCMFFYTTTGWMMWNTLMMAPMLGGRVVVYDGHPAHPGADFLWELAARTGVTSFGASPTFIKNFENLDICPKEKFDLSAIENIFLAGSPSTPRTFEWLYRNVGSDLWVTSQSGGTEFCSGLVGASPALPVHAAEIQCRTLGVDVRALNDEGEAVIDEEGELVIAAPMPSMPLFLWGDTNNERYRSAYLEQFPGFWHHGDRIKINRRGGCYVYGRSDATLNRYGVRIGTADIYSSLAGIKQILDSVIVCIEKPDGGFYMPLFVSMQEGETLDARLIAAIRDRLKTERSPRHVPDEIVQVPAVPYTLTGKKMEVPIKKILMGTELNKAVSLGSCANPDDIGWFAQFARQRSRPGG